MATKQHKVEWQLKVGTEGSEKVQALRAELDKLGKIKSFGELKKKTEDAEKAWQSATAKVRELAKEMANTDKPTKSQANAFERAKVQAARLKDQYEGNRLALHKMRGELSKSGVSTTALATAQTRAKSRAEALRTEIDRSARVQALYKKAVAATSSATDSASLSVRNMVAAYVGLNAIQSGGRYILQTARDSEQSFYNLEASVRAANREMGSGLGSLDGWTDRLRELGQELKIYSNTELRNAASRTIDMTKRLGMSIAQMDNIIRMSANLGAGKTDLEGAIERVTAALRGEAESAEFLGLTLGETYVKAQYEASNATGKLWKDLTDLEKAQARYNVLVEQASGMNGRAAESVNTLNGALSYMRATIDNALESNEDLQESVKKISAEIAAAAPDAVKFALGLAGVLGNIIKIMATLPSGTAEALGHGLIGNLLFGKKGAVLIGGASYLLQSLHQSAEGLKQSLSGDISFWDYMWSNRQELEALLDQAGKIRLAKEEEKNKQMAEDVRQYFQSIDEINQKYVDEQIRMESERAETVKAINDDLVAVKEMNLEKVLEKTKATLKEAEEAEKRYADLVVELEKKKNLAKLSTEEKIRALRRTQMSDMDAYRDKQREAEETLSRSKAALAAGDSDQAESWAQKAQEQFAALNTEVKDGEKVLIDAAQANRIAVMGVREAGDALEAVYKARIEKAKEAQKAEQDNIKQATEDIKTLEEAMAQIKDIEVKAEVKDHSSATLKAIQSEMAKIKDKTVTVTVRYKTVGKAPGKADGGRIPGYATGGRLPGYSLRDNLLGLINDRQPIGLAGGEMITNAYSTRVISRLAPGLLEELNRVRTGVDLSRALDSARGLSSGGRVAASYRFTFASGGQEASITTASKTEADSLHALAKAMSRRQLLQGG